MPWKQRPTVIMLLVPVIVLTQIMAACSPSTSTIAGLGNEAEVGAESDGEAEVGVDTAIDVIEGPDLSARGMAIVEAPPETMLPAFSTIEQVGDLGFYYVAVAGEMSLVAFDAATLTPRYQVAASPLGRLRGVGQEVLVDRNLELVFVTGYDDAVGGENGGYVAAHEAATGAERWRTSIDFFAAQPFDCGPSLCLRTISEQRHIDKATGSLVLFTRVSDRRVLYSSPDMTVTTLASVRTGEFAGIGGSASFGADNKWEVTADDLTAATGHVLDPGYGWRADNFPADNVVIVYLAPADVDGWSTIAVDSRTGNILWTRPDITPCIDSPRKQLPPVVCVTGDDPYAAVAAERIDLRTGIAQWTTALAAEGAEVVYDGTALIAWWFTESDGGNTTIDPATGVQSPGPQTALCRMSNPWHEFAVPGDESFEWSSGILFSICLDDGYLLFADEVLAAAPLLDLGTEEPLWLVDFDGIPLTTAT